MDLVIFLDGLIFLVVNLLGFLSVCLLEGWYSGVYYKPLYPKDPDMS